MQQIQNERLTYKEQDNDIDLNSKEGDTATDVRSNGGDIGTDLNTSELDDVPLIRR